MLDIPGYIHESVKKTLTIEKYIATNNC